MRLVYILILLAIYPVHAAELFGVALESSSRDQLRAAVKNAGVRLVREAGADAFFDIYQSDRLLHGSKQLFLGFVKQDNRFAFAEYEFAGLRQPEMVRRLTQKYGKPGQAAGRYMTDRAYNWQSGAITISLYPDWKAYKTRLVYFHPERLVQLQKEQHEHRIALDRQRLNYLPQAY